MTGIFWKDKNVLITGYEGFLGSNLTKALLDYKANIFGLDILTHRRDTILTKDDLEKIRVIKGSVEDFSLMQDVIKKNNIEFIFHLAAKALVGECLRDPLRAFSINIRGAWNILEAARGVDSVEAIIIASSDKAYGIQDNLPYKEDFPLAGCHPYDVSKSCADLISYTYFKTYGLPVSITRCGNIIGPGDFNFSRIVPDTINSILQNKTLIIRSDGKFTRDYIYVEDIIKGYLILAQKIQTLKLFGEAFNFSNERPISVLELVKKIYQLIGKEPDYKITGGAKYEIKNQYLSSKKAQEILDWKPKYTLEKGLEKTINWYKEFFLNK